MSNKSVNCGNLIIGNDKPFTLIAGPCQMESLDTQLKFRHH